MFAYCNNNPINRIDYTGKRSVACAETYFGRSSKAVAIPIPIPVPVPAPYPAHDDSLKDFGDKVKAWVDSLSGIKEYRDNSVYVLRDPFDNNLVKYIGRTNDPARRQWEHSNDPAHPWRKNYEMEVLVTGLTKNEAKAMEQFLISAYTVGYLENARREIAVKNVPKFESYLYAITEIYTGMPGSEVFEFISRR